jgi:hypothetical protein
MNPVGARLAMWHQTPAEASGTDPTRRLSNLKAGACSSRT